MTMKHIMAEKINEVAAKHYSHLGVSAYQIWHPLNIPKSHGGEQEEASFLKNKLRE